MSQRCLYFGVWEHPGHHLVGPHGARVEHGPEWYIGGGERREHLDATLAPQDHPYGGLCFTGGALNDEERRRCHYDAKERPEGQFLLHVLSNGFTAIQWWDRRQGDRRSNCNGTVLLEGVHTADAMLDAARLHFPSIVANLTAAGIELVDVTSELGTRTPAMTKVQP